MKRTRFHAFSSRCLIIVLPWILSASAALGAACSGDDFNDNSRDKSQWGTPINAGVSGNQLLEANGRLEFKGSGIAAWPWVCKEMSYTQDWSITADVHVGDVPLPSEETWMQVSLLVGNADDPNRRFGWVGDFAVLNFELARSWDGSVKRAFNGDIETNWVSVDLDEIGVPDTGPATGRHGSARISFSASDKTLTMWCDPDGPTNGYSWVAFCSLRVDAQGYAWGMNDSSTFRVALAGDCDGVTINSSDELWLDNFSVEPADPEPSSGVIGVDVVGNGRVLPDIDGTLLQIGEAYRLAAKPAKGFKFASWSGSVEGMELFSTNNAKLAFVMQSNLVLTATFVDVLKPSLKITAPKRKQTATNALLTVLGTAKDNGSIAAVRCQLNGGDWRDAETANGWTNWTAQVTLSPGLNTLQACAIDAAGNTSKTNSATVTYIEPAN